MELENDTKFNNIDELSEKNGSILNGKVVSNRIKWIDNGKFICICAVIITHLSICPDYIVCMKDIPTC